MQDLGYREAFVKVPSAKNVLVFSFSVERKRHAHREPSAGPGTKQAGKPGAGCQAPRSHL